MSQDPTSLFNHPPQHCWSSQEAEDEKSRCQFAWGCSPDNKFVKPSNNLQLDHLTASYQPTKKGITHVNGSTASTFYIHKKKTYMALAYILLFQKQIDLKQRSQLDTGWPRCSRTLSRSRQAQPWGVEQVPFMSIKNWYGACLYTIFKDKSIQNDPEVIMVLSVTLSDLDKLNYGEYSKYQLYVSKLTWHMFRGIYCVMASSFPVVAAARLLISFSPRC